MIVSLVEIYYIMNKFQAYFDETICIVQLRGKAIHYFKGKFNPINCAEGDSYESCRNYYFHVLNYCYGFD